MTVKIPISKQSFDIGKIMIGPNVSISTNARVGAGVRLINCIILDDVEIKSKSWNDLKDRPSYIGRHDYWCSTGRRLLFDDGKGVAKALNETSCVGDDFRGLAISILFIKDKSKGNNILESIGWEWVPSSYGKRSRDTMSHTRTSTEYSSLQWWPCVESKSSLESTITHSLVPGSLTPVQCDDI
ncbi:mannose-1-phosphate guanyltransferase alpha-like protein [Tanacetum coccineum]